MDNNIQSFVATVLPLRSYYNKKNTLFPMLQLLIV